jgi:hypothetical protein
VLSGGLVSGAAGSTGSYTITTGGTSGQFLTSAGSSGTTWVTNTTTTGYQLSPAVVIQNDPASLEVKGKIIHNGRDLEERLSTIEKVLMIPERDVTIESKYPSLKKKYDEYIKELSKARMWESLKGNENE